MIPFSPPHIDQRHIDAVVEVLKSGWITTGLKTKSFEKKLALYAGNPNTLCVNSATAGLELMLHWFGVKAGDEVIVPTYTYCATANVVVHCGATPVFVDVDENFCISVEGIRNAITEKTKAIIPVDFAGFPCDYDAINALVHEPHFNHMFLPTSENQEKLDRILVLSDGAHSIGAHYKGKRTGNLTDATAFSFHAVKNLTTAEGGAIALNLPEPFKNEEVYQLLCIKSLHGQNKDALSKLKLGAWKYDIIEPGYKCNMTDITAALGLVELDRYETETLPRRKEIFKIYDSILKNYPWAQLPLYETAERTSSYHLYPLRVRGITEAKRDEMITKVSEHEVTVNVHFIPVPMMSYYKSRGYDIKNYPVTYDNYSREISLPVYYDLKDEQARLVAETVAKSY